MVGFMSTKYFSKCDFYSKLEKWFYAEKSMFLLTKGYWNMNMEVFLMFQIKL